MIHQDLEELNNLSFFVNQSKSLPIKAFLVQYAYENFDYIRRNN